MSAAATIDVAACCARLPTIVRRYLLRTLGAQAQPITAVALQQHGRLRTGVDARRWWPFTAEQQVDPVRRRLHWRARIRLAPLIALEVDDAYADGIGSGRVRLGGCWPLAAERNVPELNAAELHRFLAEAAWYPTALLPTAGLRWSGIDSRRALATLSDHASTVTLEFRFDADGELRSVYTPARWQRIGRRYRQCGWEGRFAGHREHAGLRLPFAAEVGWHEHGEFAPVWRGEITGYAHRSDDRAGPDG